MSAFRHKTRASFKDVPVVSLPHIAYLTSVYPAPSHTFILREVTGLRDLGFEVDTCSIQRPAASQITGPEEEAALNSTFYTIQAGKKPAVLLGAIGAALVQPGRLLKALALAWRTAAPGVKGAVKQALYMGEAMILAHHLRRQGVTHLHTHFASAPANVALLTAELADIAFSYTLHGPSDLYEPEKWHLREKTARAAFVACISYFARGQAMLFSDPDHWHKLHIVHCGVIPERYELDSNQATDGQNLLFVGRLAAVKGLRILLEAFAQARATRPALTLTLVGDGDDRAHLEKLAEPLGDAVTFLGYQSQDGVAQAMAHADILVLPSFAEGLPVVLMEALAAGKPVICTQVAGVAELVEDGVSGFIVPVSDDATLAQRIGHLADNAELRHSMGIAGRQKVRDAFDVRVEAGRIGTLFANQGSADVRPAPYAAHTATPKTSENS